MHEKLFSRSALKVGQIHWYLLKADNEMQARCYRKLSGDSSKFSKLDFVHLHIKKI